MRRRISMLLAAVLGTSGFAVLIGSQPVWSLAVCAGNGTATINNGGPNGLL